MPEMRFRIRWPSGVEESCYSPSLVIKDYFEPGASYPLPDFLARSRTALQIASDRVKARYGMPCGLAMGQSSRIAATGKTFSDIPNPIVTVLSFED